MQLLNAQANCTIACLTEAEAIRMQALAKTMGRRDLSIRVLRSSRDRFAAFPSASSLVLTAATERLHEEQPGRPLPRCVDVGGAPPGPDALAAAHGAGSIRSRELPLVEALVAGLVDLHRHVLEAPAQHRMAAHAGSGEMMARSVSLIAGAVVRPSPVAWWRSESRLP